PWSRPALARASAWSPPASCGSPTAARSPSAVTTAHRPRSPHGNAAASVPAAGGRTRPNERFLSIHSPADRHLLAWHRGDAGRRARLLVAAGFGVAAGGFSDHSGHHSVARSQPRHHRRAGNGAARTAVRPDP